MFASIKNNFFAFTSAIVVHLLFLVVIMIGIDWSGKPKSIGNPEVEVVQAVVVDEKQVQAELDKLEELKKRREAEEKRKQNKAEQELRNAQDARKKEEQRLENIKQEKEKTRIAQELEKDRLNKLALETEQEKLRVAAEKRRLEDIKKEKEKAEKERIAEQDRLADLKLQQQLDAEAAREAERAAIDKKKQDKIASKKFQGELNQFVFEIKQKVSKNWFRPAKFDKGVKCTVRVRLSPVGDVGYVAVKCLPDNDVFKRSVETAVNRASPFRVSEDPDIFDVLRDLEFIFEPQ